MIALRRNMKDMQSGSQDSTEGGVRTGSKDQYLLQKIVRVEETVTSSSYASKARAENEGFLCMYSSPTTPDTNENKEAKNASHEAGYEQRWRFYGPFIEFGCCRFNIRE